MFEALHDAKFVWLYGGVLFLLLISTLIGQDPEISPPRRRQPHDHQQSQCAHPRMVEDVRHLRGRRCDWPHRLSGPVRHHLFPGDARVHDPGAHAPRRSSHAVLELLRHYAAAVLPHRHPVVRLFRYHDPRIGLRLRPHQHCHRRRHRSISWNAPPRFNSASWFACTA